MFYLERRIKNLEKTRRKMFKLFVANVAALVFAIAALILLA